MRLLRATMLLAPALMVGCAPNPDRHTLAELQRVEPDVSDVVVDDGLDQAIRGYRDFLEETPESELTPDAMRRLADLKVEAAAHPGLRNLKEVDLSGHLENGDAEHRQGDGASDGEGKDEPLATSDYALYQALNLLKGLRLLRPEA